MKFSLILLPSAFVLLSDLFPLIRLRLIRLAWFVSLLRFAIFLNL